MSSLNVEEIRRDFPILSAPGANGRPVIYLDNAASTQRPRQVIDGFWMGLAKRSLELG